MSNFYNLTNKRPGASWRDRLEELRGARSEFKNLEPIMTPAERILYGKSIKEKQDEMEPYIMKEALGEWHYAIDQYTQAVKQLQEAKSRETARWEASRLSAEMQLAENLITKTVQGSTGDRLEPHVIPKLKAMYDEAIASGDNYKARAWAEVYTGLPGMVRDYEDKLVANRLSKQAQRDAQAVRITPELERSMKQAEEAVGALNQAKHVLHDVDEGLGSQTPNGEVGNWTIYKELNRVRVNHTGEIQEIVPIERALNPDD